MSAGGERWGCLVLERASRFVVAQATGRIGEALVRAAGARAAARTGQQPLAGGRDGWRGSAAVLTQQDRRPVRSGARGRPPRVVPQALPLTPTAKQRDARGRLLAIAIRAALGTRVATPGTVHVERLKGAWRDRLNAFTRKTHAFAKTDATWDALLGVPVFEHNWLRPHPAPRIPPSARPASRLAAALTAAPRRWRCT